mmetsp:Transcript_11877/g.17711  ORF Transcript_11877/g.17711 Transcript_11877/m.17711 type:complete len:441 (+) Transcript_11877:23-1345(+)
MLRKFGLSTSPSIKSALSRCASSLPSLEVEYPVAPSAKPSSLPVPKTTKTVLKNGLSLISHDTGDKTACLSMVLNSGSRHETITEYGASLLAQRLAFKTTQKRSAIRLNRDLHDAGVVTGCAAGRENIIYSAECPPDAAGIALQAIAETIHSPMLSKWEMNDIKEKYINAIDIPNFKRSTRLMLSEAIHAAAFGPYSPLGHPLYTPCHIDPESYAASWEKKISPKKMTLVGVGVSHEALLNFGDELFTDEKEGVPGMISSPFVGGENLVHLAGASNCCVALVLESSPAGKDAATLTLLKHLLGIRLSSSMPGTEVASSSYADAGFVALTAECSAANSAKTLESVAKVLAKLAAAAPTSEEIKSAVKSAQIDLLEKSHGSAFKTAHFLAGEIRSASPGELSKVTGKALQEACAKMVKSKIGLAGVGNMGHVPSLDKIKTML